MNTLSMPVAPRAKAVVAAVPALALVAGVVVARHDVRFGLLAAAIVLGWTQLVGL